MTYTEIKEKGDKKYYYRARSIRKKKQVNKERIYLGVNLKKQELQEKEEQADKRLLNIQQEKPKISEPNKQTKRIRKTSEKDKNELPEQLSVKKHNFPEWMSQILQLAKIIDNRYDIKYRGLLE